MLKLMLVPGDSIYFVLDNKKKLILTASSFTAGYIYYSLCSYASDWNDYDKKTIRTAVGQDHRVNLAYNFLSRMHYRFVNQNHGNLLFDFDKKIGIYRSKIYHLMLSKHAGNIDRSLMTVHKENRSGYVKPLH